MKKEVVRRKAKYKRKKEVGNQKKLCAKIKFKKKKKYKMGKESFEKKKEKRKLKK